MASIKISELHLAGSELFADAESYISDLTTEELKIWGGDGNSGVACTGYTNNNQVGAVGETVLVQNGVEGGSQGNQDCEAAKALLADWFGI